MLALKLLLVPSLLAAISVAGQRWGPRVAGSLAGLPFVTGPILLLLALEHGATFTAEAAGKTIAAVPATVVYSLVYCWSAARRWTWFRCWGLAVAAWFAGFGLAGWLAPPWQFALAISAPLLLLAQRAFPAVERLPANTALPRRELVYCMLAGAALTLCVTGLAQTVGSTWSGLLSVFPVFGSVLAVFSHRAYGAEFTIALLHNMSRGLLALMAFASVLTSTLAAWGTAGGFFAAIGAAYLAHAISRSNTFERWCTR